MSEPKKNKRLVGGSSAERGLDFQARVIAIVMVHLLAERTLNWLAGVLQDVPYQIDAETGGPGDDICFVCKSGQIIEVQVKRGLRIGQDLWGALVDLAEGVCNEEISAGVLVVCPNSSNSIKSILADDIIRMGTGRTDGLRKPGNEFLQILKERSINVVKACCALRIVTVAAIDGNQEAENTAHDRLTLIVQDSSLAWLSLVNQARRLIQIRGRVTGASIYRELTLRNAQLKTDSANTSIQLQAVLRQWLWATYSQLSLIGVSRPVNMVDCWIPLTAAIVKVEDEENQDLTKALNKYHEYSSHGRHSDVSVDAHTIGRFVKKAVILGGPGIGKSTLLKKLALEYSKDGFLVLFIRLSQITILMKKDGRRFEDCLIEAAFSASGLRNIVITLNQAVILCDGLDECGSFQSMIIEAVHAFTSSHPDARVIITSRPIGYLAGLLGEWRHYELQPLEDDSAKAAISTVLSAMQFPSTEKRDAAINIAKEQLDARHIKGVAARSPLMLTLIAALAAKGIESGTVQTTLYRQIFRLIENHSSTRMHDRLPSGPERNRFLELLGWLYITYGNEPYDQTIERCALLWSKETGKRILECLTIIQECLNYWENLGIVERVRTLTEEAITFVHKSFGEFAAAQYLSKCNPTEQREMVIQAICTPQWREMLSFASHLGLSSLILEIWTELTLSGDSVAIGGLDAAIELIVQSGVPNDSKGLVSFVECCWNAVANNSSRIRYVGGDALCLIAHANWSVIREQTLTNLQAKDDWIRLVAWACLCISSEENVPYQEMFDNLLTFETQWPPQESYGSQLNKSAAGRRVTSGFILGAVRRILSTYPDKESMDTLNKSLVHLIEHMNIGTLIDIEHLYRVAGYPMPEWQDYGSINPSTYSYMNDRWGREVTYLMEMLDDPMIVIDNEDLSNGSSFDLGALISATNFWQMPIRTLMSLSDNREQDLQRRDVLQLVIQAAGLDTYKLIKYARLYREIFQNRGDGKYILLSSIPNVDVIPRFDTLVINDRQFQLLLDVFLTDNEYFKFNAFQILCSLQKDKRFFSIFDLLFTDGRGVTLFYAAQLAELLPHEQCQQIILQRLTFGPLTDGCHYLYPFLKPPFGVEHESVVLRGLSSLDPMIAVEAAEIAPKLIMSPILLEKFIKLFEEWKTKEAPYPTEFGVVPPSPRDALAKILVSEVSTNTSLLIDMLQDTRPKVRDVAVKPLLDILMISNEVHEPILNKIEIGEIDSTFLHQMILSGIFVGDDALKIIPFLKHESPKIRFHALSVLNSVYLPLDIVRCEAECLILDSELEVRETAYKILSEVPI